jgi:hypothetical protein
MLRTRLSLSLILVAALTALTHPSSAAVRPAWRESIGQTLRAVAVAPDGSVYTVGSKRTSITAEAVLVKLAPDGTRLWSRAWLPFAQASTDGVSVDVAPDGRVVWIGQVQGQCEGAGWFLEVVGPGGRLIRRYVTPGWECLIAETIGDVAVGNGFAVVAGFDHGCCGDTLQEGWVRAFDLTAHPMWAAPFEPPAPTPSAWYDRATGVAIGGLGNVYVAGWAARERPPAEPEAMIDGTVALQQVSPDGAVLWRRRVAVPMRSTTGSVSVGTRGDRVVVAAGIRGARVEWRSGVPTDGWLGGLTPGGVLLWSRRWDVNKPSAANPAQVGIDPDLVTWVVGTRRDTHDRGLDLFVRRYGRNGALLDATSLDGGVRFLHGSGVAMRAPSSAYVAGFVGEFDFVGLGGRVWRLSA